MNILEEKIIKNNFMSKSSNEKVHRRILPENEQEISSGLGQCLNPISDTSLQIIADNLNINTE